MFVAFGITSLAGSARMFERPDTTCCHALTGNPISIESFSDSLLKSSETGDDGVDARSCR
jgi:hypothetical protein